MADHTEVFNKDSWGTDVAPDTNYGPDGSFAVIKSQSEAKEVEEARAFAAVDFSELADLTLAAQVTSAFCWCRFVVTTGQASFSARWVRNVDAWAELVVTWNNQPAVDAACRSDTVVMTGGPWKMWTITDMIKDAVTNRSKVWDASLIHVGWELQQINEAWFSSREDGTEASWPYIVINYDAEEPPAGVGRSQAYVMGSRMLEPAPTRGWNKRSDLQGLMVPAGC